MLQNKTNSIAINLPSNVEFLTKVYTFVRSLNVMGKYVFLYTDNAAIAALAISVIGNMNKVVIVNNFIVKFFDSEYQVGEIIYCNDIETITFKE